MTPRVAASRARLQRRAEDSLGSALRCAQSGDLTGANAALAAAMQALALLEFSHGPESTLWATPAIDGIALAMRRTA